MTNSVIPAFLTKVSNYLNNNQNNTSQVSKNEATSQSIWTQDSANTSDLSLEDNGKRAKDSYGIFDFKYDAKYDNENGDRKQCKEAYDNWTKSDDFKTTKSTYENLTNKQNSCNSLWNKAKNIFGRGQTWTEQDNTKLNDTLSHIDIMTSRGGVGE